MGRLDRVLIVAAHPDDEVLGCGGAMAHHADKGNTVDVLFLADGITSRDGRGQENSDEDARRRQSARDAALILGANSPHFLNFPDQMLDQVALLTIVKAIERYASYVKPTLVYTHHRGDLNMDHRIVANAALTVFRPLPDTTVRAIYGFEVLSSTEWRFGAAFDAFQPTRFLDVSKTNSRKMQALQFYHEEMRAFPHPRSYEAVEALTRLRGATVGLKAAEAFSVYREIVTWDV